MSEETPRTSGDDNQQETNILVAVLQRGWKLLLAGAIIIAVLGLIYLTPLREVTRQPAKVSEYLKTLGWIAPVAFAALTAVVVSVGFPRLAMCIIGGLAFGFVPGLLWANLGALVGSYATFAFVRMEGRDFIMRKWPRLHKYERLLSGGGVWTVILAKQVPMNGLIVNALLGLTRVRHRHFLLGTAIGVFPEAIPFTLAGAGIATGTFGKSAAYIGLAVALFVAAALVVRWLARRSRATLPDTEAGKPDDSQVTENK